jgi:hypothetical protein
MLRLAAARRSWLTQVVRSAAYTCEHNRADGAGRRGRSTHGLVDSRADGFMLAGGLTACVAHGRLERAGSLFWLWRN